ncbi:MAG TPA: O-antigen ligase family protein [Gaiellaceae bacterium]|nr:O-antigen ligase family protein [Gaiellaceae bacterium]
MTKARDAAVCLAVAAAVFFLAYANGGFDVSTRAYAAIVAWWLLGLGALIGIGSGRLVFQRYVVAAPALLALFALWTLISIEWAPDAERAFAQFDQVSLYVAVFVLALILTRLVPVPVVVGGVAVALSAVAIVAFVSRVFPSSFGAVSGTSLLQALHTRLSFPLGYWNGLGIAVALAYPLLFSVMESRRSRLASAAAALPLPVIAVDMYLTSSRGAFVTSAVAVVAYLALGSNRWTGLAATIVAAGSGALAVSYVLPRKALVNGRMQTALGVHQGHQAALVIGLIALGAAVVWLGVAEFGRRLPSVPSVLGWATAGVLAAGAVVVIAAAHPIRRFDAFKQTAPVGGSGGTFVENHLLSSSGSGRWQLWHSAVSEFSAHPLNGGGAGSWQFWWLQHGSIPLFSQYAHSLYLETLAELGIVGFLLLAGALLVAGVGAVRSALLLRVPEVGGAAACGIAFFAAAAFDWVWQLGAVATAGVGMLAVALGALPAKHRLLAFQGSRFVRPLAVAAAVAAIVLQVPALAESIHLQNSQAADAAGQLTRATSEALAAKAAEPWAASPYVQLALINEQQVNYATARRYIGEAIRRSPLDWRLWLIATRLDTERGSIPAARRELAETRRLDVFASFLQNTGG